MYRVHGMSMSGNCYKVRLLLEQLQQPYEWLEIDTRSGVTRTPAFLSKNPNGRVPTLELGPGAYLPESDAILYYLAEGSKFWPADRLERSRVLQWMFFEQYSHEPYIAVARYICKLLPPGHARRAELPLLLERGYQALQVMEQHLSGREFFVGNQYSIADIALYAYTHCAADGGFDLQRFARLRAWLASVERQPGFVSMNAE